MYLIAISTATNYILLFYSKKMQLKNLIFVLSITAASVSSVFGAAPVDGSYESFKACVSGNQSESCPTLRQFYADDAQYKQQEQVLKTCLGGNVDACKEWKQGQPEGLKSYAESVKKNIKIAKSEKSGILGNIRKALANLTDKLRGKKDVKSSALARRSIKDHIQLALEFVIGVPISAFIYVDCVLLEGKFAHDGRCDIPFVNWDR